MKIYPWQLEMLDKMTKFKGRGMIQITGRQMGKSSTLAYQRLFNDVFASADVSDIKLSEGTVYGSRYYTAEPIGGRWHDMELWCLETFGETGSIWSETKNLTPGPLQRWYSNDRKFWFRNEVDRMVFVLKWR